MPQVHVVEDYGPSLIACPCIAEPKYDGHRCIITIDPQSGRASARTRRGHNVTSHLSSIIRSIRSAIMRARLAESVAFDGELIHPRGPNEVTAICRSHSHLRDKYLRYVAYDLPIQLGTYLERRAVLRQLLGSCRSQRLSIAASTEIQSLTALRRHYRQALADGHEGIVVKEPDSLYGQPGSWQRIKPGIPPWG